MFVVGIDGGGTKTRVAVCAADGTLLHRETLGAFNLSAIGEDGFRRRVGEILTLCGDMRACGALCVGGAGASGAAMGEILRAELAAHGFAGKLLLCGDHEIALAGAMQTPGCVLIAGTGSICYGKNAAGEHFRCGGGGHIIDDPGSGYALGRDALAAALLKLCDQFRRKSVICKGDKGFGCSDSHHFPVPGHSVLAVAGFCNAHVAAHRMLHACHISGRMQI